MRIAVITPHYPPTPGGISDYARQWALALASAPAAPELTVITHPLARAETAFAVWPVQGDWGPRGFAALRRHLAAARPDVVVVHYEPHMYQRRGLSLAFALFVWSLGRRGIPVVTIAHELYYGRHEGPKVQPLGWVQRLALAPLFGGSARVVLTVPDRLARMRALFPGWAGRFVLLPVGSNLAPADAFAPGAWREAHGIPPGALLLLFMGLAHPSKNLPALRQVLDRLEATGQDARLLIVGGGTLDHPRALGAGFLPPDEARRALTAADLVLLPFGDGASTRRTSLMNALAAGKPVVSTAGANTDPAAFPPDAVRLVPANDGEAFTAAVLALAADAGAREALGRAGRSLYEARYAWDVLVDAWLPLLQEAARDGQSVHSCPPPSTGGGAREGGGGWSASDVRHPPTPPLRGAPPVDGGAEDSDGKPL